MAPIHRAYFGLASTTVSLPIFLEDPARYWWLAIPILLGVAFIIDDVIYHVTGGKLCALCKIFPE